MAIEVRVPRLPESVSDATLVTWHKKTGELVQRDETLVDLETDKVVLEVPAPQTGRLDKVLKQDGETVKSDEVIAVIEPDGARPEQSVGKPQDVPVPTPVSAPATEARTPERAEVRAAVETGSPQPAPQAPEPEAPAQEEAALPLSPAVRHLIQEHRLDPQQIKGTGRGGRLTKEDVVKHLGMGEPVGGQGGDARGSAGPPRAAGEALGEAAGETTGQTPAVPVTEAQELGRQRPERRVTMTRLRARIAERLVQAQHTAAILTTMNEVDMQAVMELRKRLRERFEQRYGVKLGIMSFFIKACVEALRHFPIVNASVDGNDIVYHDYYDIGIAVDSPRGLVVPVLRDTDRLSFAQIESGIAGFATKAKEGTLSIEDLSGGTFSISNGGVFGSLLSTPILNPPQSAILGMHKIEERPVVLQGEIRIRPMMYVALSYDHRIIDGRDAVRFLATVKELLEDPARLLLQV
jgi:2-oxoglutarate dehydrogenase E2 component (dihydrolipoamide succinyltransferase)